jgi:hypothetical protein
MSLPEWSMQENAVSFDIFNHYMMKAKKTILTLQTVAILSLMVAVLPLMGKSDVIWPAMAMLQRSVVALTD